ncbi:hypothetical protein CLCR_09364 [Cladophialophora carrionii]|uniref:Uncharacterized protein n=1 Tax=Cladophialophora carrionii TaxID=86049 RepID=A0A1C1CRT1_9EURO|nr:hypothetical protein CLCR_09364 [Cladophialophora carrionii]
MPLENRQQETFVYGASIPDHRQTQHTVLINKYLYPPMTTAFPGPSQHQNALNKQWHTVDEHGLVEAFQKDASAVKTEM